ncbi:MAG: hypothetical protein P8X57_11500 [Cyclobacteriaceae bacterium]
MFVNKGFDPDVIEEYRRKIAGSGRNIIIDESAENSDEYKQFNFIGMFEGKPVVYDAALYTLRLHHSSELYEVAEHRAARHFPEFKQIRYREDENGDLQALDDLEEEIGLYMAEVMMELEEEGEIKVHEFVDLDPNVDFGIGIDAALNVDTIDENVISKFVNDYNEETLKLDDTLYTFMMEDEEIVD